MTKFLCFTNLLKNVMFCLQLLIHVLLTLIELHFLDNFLYLDYVIVCILEHMHSALFSHDKENEKYEANKMLY